jgi:phosphoglycolate phosphatase
MKRTAILFDLDGTLLDTLEDLADSMNAVLAARGWPVHELGRYRYFVGDGVETLARRAMPASASQDATAVEQVVAAMRQEYGNRWHVKTRPYEGILGLLDAADSRGIACAILSNKPHAATVQVVSHFFPGRHFAGVWGARPGIPIKPDPAGALEAARSLGREPEAFWYLGDTDTDMETARRAGMHSVGVLWGFRDETELRRAGAAALVRHPREVISLLDEQGSPRRH